VVSRPGRFTPEERARRTHWNIRTGLDDVERRKILLLLGLELDPSAVQSVTSRYTGCATPAAPPQRDFILAILMDKLFPTYVYLLHSSLSLDSELSYFFFVVLDGGGSNIELPNAT
jgi:hypothetical protein